MHKYSYNTNADVNIYSSKYSGMQWKYMQQVILTK